MDDPVEFWRKKAEDCRKSGKLEDAVMYLNKAREFEDPRKKEKFWYKKAIGLLETGEYEESVKCLDNELQVSKDDPDACYAKAIALFALGQYIESVECFNRSYEIKYGQYLKTLNQAKSLKDHKKMEQVVKYYDIINKIEPLQFNFWFYRGLALHQIKKYNEAIESYDNALETKPKDPAIIIYHKARSELSAGRPDSCIELLEKACELDSSNKKLLRVDPLFEELKHHPRFRILLDYANIATP